MLFCSPQKIHLTHQHKQVTLTSEIPGFLFALCIFYFLLFIIFRSNQEIKRCFHWQQNQSFPSHLCCVYHTLSAQNLGQGYQIFLLNTSSKKYWPRLSATPMLVRESCQQKTCWKKFVSLNHSTKRLHVKTASLQP